MPLAVHLHYTFSVHKLPGFLLKLVSQHTEALGCALRFWRACTAVFWWAVASCNCRRMQGAASGAMQGARQSPAWRLGSKLVNDSSGQRLYTFVIGFCALLMLLLLDPRSMFSLQGFACNEIMICCYSPPLILCPLGEAESPSSHSCHSTT